MQPVIVATVLPIANNFVCKALPYGDPHPFHFILTGNYKTLAG